MSPLGTPDVTSTSKRVRRSSVQKLPVVEGGVSTTGALRVSDSRKSASPVGRSDTINSSNTLRTKTDLSYSHLSYRM